jgi:hypothetical protein
MKKKYKVFKINKLSILLALLFANQFSFAQQADEIFIIPAQIPINLDSVKPLKTIVIKALFETKKIEQMLEEAKDSVKYYQGNTFKLTYFQNVHPSLIKRHWEYPDRMRGEIFYLTNEQIQAQKLFNKKYEIFLLQNQKSIDSIDFQNFKYKEFRLIESSGFSRFELKNYALEEYNRASVWDFNLQLVKNFHFKSNYRLGFLTGIGVAYSNVRYFSTRPIKTLGFADDSLRIGNFWNANTSFQIPLELNYTFYQKDNRTALRLKTGIINRLNVLREWDNRHSLYTENFGEV